MGNRHPIGAAMQTEEPDRLELELKGSGDTESEDDLRGIDPSVMKSVVVFATDWTAEVLVNQLQKGNIDLDPAFQRRDAWTPERKSRFIESVIVGLPIPQIVLAEQPEGHGAFLVIDGKQRLLSLQQFAGINLLQGQSPLVLRGLKIRTDLNGKSFADIRNDPRLRKYLRAFENQSIRTVVLRNWQSEDLLYMVFLRLNSESVPLSPQELRQALHPGPFVRFAEEYSAESRELMRALGTDRPDFRMRDVELLVRYYAFKNFFEDYSGNLKEFLDNACCRLNRRWNEGEEAEIREQARELDASIAAAFDVFGNDAFRKWNGDSFERHFNRAIFDVVVHWFSDPKVRNSAKVHSKDVVDAFKALCVENPQFRRAIETTTKSKEATRTRFSEWNKALVKATRARQRG